MFLPEALPIGDGVARHGGVFALEGPSKGSLCVYLRLATTQGFKLHPMLAHIELYSSTPALFGNKGTQGGIFMYEIGPYIVVLIVRNNSNNYASRNGALCPALLFACTGVNFRNTTIPAA